MAILLPRYTYCYDSFGNQIYGTNCNSSWSNWGRWVALALIILFALLVFFSCACVTSRRRRAAGRNPYWGTGWAANGYRPNQHNNYGGPPPQNNYYAYDNTGAAPPYAPRSDQQTGIEMPSRPDNTYVAPPGPPNKY